MSRTICPDPVRRPGSGLCLLAVLAVLVAGCGGSGASHSRAHRTKSTSTSPAASGPRAIASATLEVQPSGGGSPQPLAFSVYDLRRDGPFLVLDFGIRSSLGGYESTLQPPTGQNGPVEAGDGEDDQADYFTGAGIYLVDPAGDVAYHAVRDGQGRPYASEISGGDASTTYLEWVRFPAPPASVTSLDIAEPTNAGLILHVPISDSATAPTAGTGEVTDPPAPFSQSETSTNTAGLTLPALPLQAIAGNPTASENQSGKTVTITLGSDVLFHFDKSNLTSAATQVLGQAAAQIKQRAVGTVKVNGYTDDIGSDAVNQPLSQARAASVVGALRPLTHGIRYTAAGHGDADPVAPNQKPGGADNPTGRALNRRVTISFPVKQRTPPISLADLARKVGLNPATSTTVAFSSEQVGAAQNDRYQATFQSLTRDGNTLVARLSLTCSPSQSGNSGGGCNTEQDFDGTPTIPPAQPYANLDTQTYFSLAGFYLEDPSTGEILAPLYDDYENPVTSFAASLPQGQATTEWIYFPVPPAGTNSLSLVMPRGVAATAPLTP